jgi:hypothetical protein
VLATTDPRVDTYIDALPAWQRAACAEGRRLIHEADPDIQETIKRTDRPYFVLQGNVAALLAAKDHVNVFVYDGGLTADPAGLVTGGHGNATARTIALWPDSTLDRAAFVDFIRDIVAVNRAGGWRRLSRRGVAP